MLLVVGATGGVGSLAVQLAARAGVRVIAPALPEDEDFLRGLGVSDVLPRDGDVDALVRGLVPDGVDALLDLVYYAPGTYDAALKPDARVASPTGAAGDGPGRTNVMATPTAENLQRLAALLTDGTLRIPVQQTYELAQAPVALGALAGEHTQGKLAFASAETPVSSLAATSRPTRQRVGRSRTRRARHATEPRTLALDD